MTEVTGVVRAVCVSGERGVQKREIPAASLIAGHGLEGDAHAGDWHRQVSLISYGKVQKFNEGGAGVSHGDFGENLVVEGIDLGALPVGSLLECGDCALEITQIGKECHTHCQIHQKMGDCIMPREGVFARVARGGAISVGDVIRLAEAPARGPRAAVLILSDKGAKGERKDESGPLIARMLRDAGYTLAELKLLPDERGEIEAELINLADRRQVDLILTSGGTGFSPRDITPEATTAIAERMAPGIAEAMRAHSMRITGRAMLSRGVAAIRGGSLIVNLPGSPKAAGECLDAVLPHLGHGIEVLRGKARDCADSTKNDNK